MLPLNLSLVRDLRHDLKLQIGVVGFKEERASASASEARPCSKRVPPQMLQVQGYACMPT
jgi:hypothetical protein